MKIEYTGLTVTITDPALAGQIWACVGKLVSEQPRETSEDASANLVAGKFAGLLTHEEHKLLAAIAHNPDVQLKQLMHLTGMSRDEIQQVGRTATKRLQSVGITDYRKIYMRDGIKRYRITNKLLAQYLNS